MTEPEIRPVCPAGQTATRRGDAAMLNTVVPGWLGSRFGVLRDHEGLWRSHGAGLDARAARVVGTGLIGAVAYDGMAAVRRNASSVAVVGNSSRLIRYRLTPPAGSAGARNYRS